MAQQQGGGGYFPQGSSTFGLDLSGLYVGEEGSNERSYIVRNPFQSAQGAAPAPTDYSGFGETLYRGLFGGGDANAPQAPAPQGRGSLVAPQMQGAPGAGQAAGQGPTTSSFTLPALGPQPQMPDAPQYVAPNFQGALQTLSQSGPAAPNYEVYQDVPQRPDPVAPNTTPDQKYLESLQGTAPEAPDEEQRQENNLISVLGALAAGAASGDGTTSGTLSAVGARGAQAMLQNAEREAQQDEQYRQAQQQYNRAVFQAEKSIAEQKRKYEQAVRDTDFSNETSAYEGQLRAEQARQEYASSVAAHRRQIAQLEMDAARERADAVNKNLTAEYKNQVAQYEVDSKATGYEVNDGQITARVKNPDGSMTVKTTQIGGSGIDQLERMGDALDVAGKFADNGQESASRTIASQSAMSLALERGDPALALNVAAESMAPNAQLYMQDYEDELVKAQEQLQSRGILPGSSEYPKAINSYMAERLAEMVSQNPSILKGMARTNPMASVVYDKFYQPGG